MTVSALQCNSAHGATAKIQLSATAILINTQQMPPHTRSLYVPRLVGMLFGGREVPGFILGSRIGGVMGTIFVFMDNMTAPPPEPDIGISGPRKCAVRI